MKFKCQDCGKCCTEEFGMVVLEDEAKTLRKKAEELNITLNLTKTQNNLYKFNHRSCPFYQNKCLIYEDRPALCRAFPILSSGLKDGNIRKSTHCPENQRLKDHVKHHKTVKDVIETYGDCYRYCYYFEKKAE